MAAMRCRPALLAPIVLAGLVCGCREQPGDELAIRECLFVYNAARHGEAFEGREVPVCGSLRVDPDGVTRLSDFVRGGGHVEVDLLPGPQNDPGMAQALTIVERLRKGEKHSPEARFHGRIEVRPGAENVLHVTRVDWIGGRPRDQ